MKLFDLLKLLIITLALSISGAQASPPAGSELPMTNCDSVADTAKRADCYVKMDEVMKSLSAMPAKDATDLQKQVVKSLESMQSRRQQTPKAVKEDCTRYLSQVEKARCLMVQKGL
jgi:hypothetical protein